MSLKKLVKSLPPPLEQGFRYVYSVVPVSLRYGKVFREMYAFLQESQWWSKERLEDYQMQQLESLLKHAYESVPYYRRVLDEYGIKPHHIQTKEDLKLLPYLTKDSFRDNFKDMIAQNYDLRAVSKSHTSGTTGKPLQFYKDKFCNQKELSFIYHQWARVGYKPGEPVVQLRGAIINSENPVHYNPVHRILRLSPHICNKQIVEYYLEKMKKFKARFLHGYPSAIASFAYAIKKYGLTVPFKLQSVLFASETVYSWEREVVEEVFDCRVFSHYGNAEQVVLAAECEDNTLYHCLPQYGITEIDPDTNEIIATGFLNYVTPFIRYRTTDVASLPISEGCPNCGRQYFPIFKKVEGRLEDFIISPNGTMIAPAVITHPFKDLKTIKETQLIQKSVHELLLRAVTWENSDPEVTNTELAQLCYNLKQIIGDMNIETQIVSEIERNKAGKFRWIISEVSKGSLETGLKG